MDNACSLLSPLLRDHLIGVIDLKDAQAVHAIAGQRAQYMPVRISRGDPIDLADRYLALGIRRLYIADLNGLECSEAQVKSLTRLLNHCRESEETLLDFGWNGTQDMMTELMPMDGPTIKWIVPTESAKSLHCLRDACSVIEPHRVLISLDYRHGKLVSDCGEEDDWLNASAHHGLGGVVVLDLADVGTGSGGSTSPICDRIARRFPSLRIYSGGGIRNADDARTLLDVGCDYCLVATSIHTLMN